MPLDDAVVGAERRRPGVVAELRGALGRSDDVGEQHGRQHAVGRCGAALAGEERLDLVSTWSASPANHLSSPSSSTSRACRIRSARYLCVFAMHVAVATPVQQQRRRLDALERGATSVQEQVEDRLEIPGPPASRSPRAHQRRLAASPAQLGASRSTTAPVPTVCSKMSMYFARADSVSPKGWSGARV